MQNQAELGFFKSLFDLKMTSFITMRVIRLLYAIAAIVILIFTVIFMIFIFWNDGNGPGLVQILQILLLPIASLLYLIIVRIWVEFLANLYRIGDNTQKMVDAIPTA
jgi:membrane protein YdbS with pleckstrin-like domain